MMRTLCFLLAALSLYGSSPVWGATLSVQDVERAADVFLADAKAPGVVVAVQLPDGSAPLLVARGVSCLSHDSPMRPESVVRIGSVSKLFTALRIKMYIDEGKLTYDTPLAAFYPDLPNAAAITIRHLLEHSAGIADIFDLPALRENPAKAWPPEELTALTMELKPRFAPGEQQKYNNCGYILLGCIIQKISGKPWADEIRDAIAVPLGMKQCLMGDETTVIREEAHGYAYTEDGARSKPLLLNIGYSRGAGALVTTALDVLQLARMDTLLQKPWITSGLSPAQCRYAPVSVDLNGLCYQQYMTDGLTLLRFPDGMQLVGKDGNYPGFTSMFWRDPKTGAAIVVLANQDLVNIELTRLVLNVFNLLHQNN